MNTFLKRFTTLMLSLVMVFALALPAAAATGAEPSDDDIVIPVVPHGEYTSSVAQAADALRDGMKAREGEIVVKVRTARTDAEAFMQEIFAKAVEHTGEPTEGDYLLWQIPQYGMTCEYYAKGGYNYMTITYTVSYYTTAAQEAQVDAAVKTVLDELNVYEADELTKITAIYDYICENVTYDNAGLAANNQKIYSAYAALVDKTAVCQGYANLFYRLALELGVDARLIAGTSKSQPHAWNIVRMGGKYYNVDTTWDAPRAAAGQEYAYFLRCETDFAEHTRDAEYLTDAFQAAYPMAENSHGATTPGDLDGVEGVNTDDVIALLLHVSMPGTFHINGDADFTGDGKIDTDDVIQLLLHVSLPDVFPLYATQA